ncbi:GNAT family N-acetyltransferase [Deinococcus cavernae]|uniref:GNAT family N-acetyltransferase n=1 Tax=Deinococcus cavernae TaxID=2320857 RepID=A0A418VEH4_9DEIO|nr:arsenic resistance N-acetyltransferase ArsN2 [Deinococcus cavernae]RJF74506.1 GNAT family N-acetyltransferase [Deinococcus cavernae]
MKTRLFHMTDLPAVQAFLRDHSLPTAGIVTNRGGFLLVEDQSKLIGVTGLEVHGNVGLLRSVAVDSVSRSQGIATELVGQAIQYARQFGLTDLYLLTTTAEHYFPRFGFKKISRSAAPAALQASAEFQGVCPETAILMHLPLEKSPMTQTDLPDVQSTAGFLDTVRGAPTLPLEFRLYGEALVPAGYHVTEVKAVSIESMDCGGQANSWRETVIQLMDGSPAEAAQGFMTTRKFLGIYDRVAARIPVHAEAEVRFEYGNVTTPAMQFHMASVEVQPERVVVDLRHPGVMCKATGASSNEGQCCGPSEPKEVVPIFQEATRTCCTPAEPELIQLG